MTRLMPIKFNGPRGRSNGIEGTYAGISSGTIYQRAQILLSKTTVYQPKVFLARILESSRYSKLHVDGLGRRFLDRIRPSHEISPDGLAETLDEISQALRVQIGMLELRYPKDPIETEFDLIVLGNAKNKASLEALRRSLERFKY